MARGFSLVSDDVTELRRLSSGTLMATAPEATRYHMDVRGLGIVHVPSLYGVAAVRRSKRLDMIVHLQSCEHGSHGISPAFEAQERDILGIPVPSFITPVAPGRDAAQLVVTAALNYRLRELGHDAVKELDQRLMQQLATQRGQRGD